MLVILHDTDLFANLAQPIFLLPLSMLLVLSPLKFEKALAGVDCAGADIDNFVNAAE